MFHKKEEKNVVIVSVQFLRNYLILKKMVFFSNLDLNLKELDLVFSIFLWVQVSIYIFHKLEETVPCTI